MKLPYCLICILFAMSSSLQAAQFYVDSLDGNDTNDGTCPDFAWSSLEKVSQTAFKPGDVIHLRSGRTFSGQLVIRSSGTEGNPIRVTRYDSGDRPHLKGEGKVNPVVLLENVSHVTVQGIEVSNTGPEPMAKRRGVLVRLTDMGVARSIILRDLFVRDVNGVISKKEGGGTGIRWEVTSRKKKTRIDGLLIENCHVLRCDRDGIKGWMEPWDDMSFLSTNVVIRNNLLEDIGGDGVGPLRAGRGDGGDKTPYRAAPRFCTAREGGSPKP
ncbi:MAG: hypothetical protein AB3N33_10390, partial [Puniceicoccaceae bacterium]